MNFECAMANALELARKFIHVESTPLHLAVALLSDPSGLFRQSILNSTYHSNATYNCDSFYKILTDSLKNLPSQSPPPDVIPSSVSLLKLTRRAHSSQKSDDDDLAVVGRLILGLLKLRQISDCLKQSCIPHSRLPAEVKHLIRKPSKKVRTNFPALNTYCRDHIEQARKLDHGVVEHPRRDEEEEIMKVAQILSRSTKNHPILMDYFVTGKTAVVEGLARRIVRGDVPINLLDVKLFALNVDALAVGGAGAKERLKSVLKEVEEAEGEVILFIDFHFKVSDLFRTVLKRKGLRCIGAMTVDERRKHAESVTYFWLKFAKRFQQV